MTARHQQLLQQLGLDQDEDEDWSEDQDWPDDEDWQDDDSSSNEPDDIAPSLIEQWENDE